MSRLFNIITLPFLILTVPWQNLSSAFLSNLKAESYSFFLFIGAHSRSLSLILLNKLKIKIHLSFELNSDPCFTELRLFMNRFSVYTGEKRL